MNLSYCDQITDDGLEYISKYNKLTYKDMSILMSENDFNMSLEQISKICAKYNNNTSEIIKDD